MKKILLAILCLTFVTPLGFTEEKEEKEKHLYLEDFEKIEIGALPEDFMVLEGEFHVVEMDGNRVLELAKEPLQDFCVLFGPRLKENFTVSAQIKSERTGRLYPRFGIGLNGVAGHKLLLFPAQQSLQIVKDDEVKAKAKFKWESAQWTSFRFQLKKVNDEEWLFQGKCWQGKEEPEDWMISYSVKEEPFIGRTTLWGTPYSAKEIYYDNLIIDELKEHILEEL